MSISKLNGVFVWFKEILEEVNVFFPKNNVLILINVFK